jgi:hypothetical protein
MLVRSPLMQGAATADCPTDRYPLEFRPVRAREGFTIAACATALVWINLYICRELFTNSTAYMNSMHGFWSAIAKHASNSWLDLNWWPNWDCGIPFEFTYAPLVPAWTAIWASARGISYELAFQSVTGVVYCALPVTLFLMAWVLTRKPGASFLAGVFYSLTAPTQLVVPDAAFAWGNFWVPRRFYVAAVWDETPHLVALAMLPLVILFLSLSIRKKRLVYYWSAALCIAIATLASDFAPVEVAMAAFCLLFVLCRENYKRNIVLVTAIGAFAYAMTARYLPPSLIGAIHRASVESGEGWTLGSVTAIAITGLGWIVLWRYVQRWTKDWSLQFFALFAYLTSSPPLLAAYLHREFLPQPGRYKNEMELGLALVVVFGTRPLFMRLSAPPKAALLLLLLGLSGEQIVSQREYSKATLFPHDMGRTIEYRASRWAEENLRDVRVMLPGSIAQWANDFTDLMQYAGGPWSSAYNLAQQRGLRGIFNGGDTPQEDALVSLAWLKAYGVDAVAVDGPKSDETWKPFAHPEKFEGVLPVLWRSDDVTFYRVPRRSPSFAHVMPASAIVRRAPRGARDIAEVERYVVALDDSSLPAAHFAWQSRNQIRITTTAATDQAVSIQVSYHPGWHARAGDRSLAVQSDGLGLMWLDPRCAGPCEIEIDYDGGWELRLCRAVSFAAVGLVLLLPMVLLVLRRGRSGLAATN